MPGEMKTTSIHAKETAPAWVERIDPVAALAAVHDTRKVVELIADHGDECRCLGCQYARALDDRDDERAQARTYRGCMLEGVAREEKLRSLVKRFVSRLGLNNRWPCQECGREHAQAPLKMLEVKREDGRKHLVGCHYCNLDDLIDEARGATEGP